MSDIDNSPHTVSNQPANTLINQSFLNSLGNHIADLTQPTQEHINDINNPQYSALSYDGFPKEVRQFIDECVNVYGTHIELWIGATIAATASSIGQSAVLKTKYENSPVLWLATVGLSGLGKTEPFSRMLKTIYDKDAERFLTYKKELAEYIIQEKKAKKNKEDPPPKPIQVQSLLIDATPEAIGIAHENNKAGITIHRDELIGLFNDFDRYSRSGEQQSMLSSWSQQPYKVNRVSRPPIFINQPFINVVGGIQPGVLSELGKDGRNVNGFLPRFCFVYPDDLKAPNYSKHTLSKGTLASLKSYYSLLINRPGFREYYYLSPEADSLYEQFFNKNKAIINNQNNEYLNSVAAKLDIIVLRLALILHISHEVYSNPTNTVPGETMQHAINITEYFRYTAIKVMRLIIDRPPISKENLIRTLANEYELSQSEIGRNLKVSQPYVSKVLNSSK
jgi:hypothetical protein